MNVQAAKPNLMRLGAMISGLGITILAVLAVMGPSAYAADSGPSLTGDVCLQQLFGTPATNANKVNCTANDISLSQVISVSPTSCTKGTTFDLQATYRVNVTANARYDAGFIFRLDGGSNARGDGLAADGVCSLSGLGNPPGSSPGLNLDGDTCGDLNSGQYTVTFTIPDVECKDTNNNGKLNLPYCTSWHSNQGTQCSISNPFSLANAPAFKPDTKSKCVCDDNFEVPVAVETASLNVVKTAAPTTLPEPGGEVTYTVDVKNTATVESVVIKTLVDDIYGNLADATNPKVTGNSCVSLVDKTLAPGETKSCQFKALAAGNSGDKVTDIVKVCADQPGVIENICGEDSADVNITNIYTEPTVQKTAQATNNCRVDVTYQIVVSNNSAVDVLTVNSLSDDKFGNIAAVQGNVISTTCSLPKNINPLLNYTCSFVGRITDADCEIDHTNTVTAGTVDDDGETSSPTDDATVTVTSTP